MSKVNSSTPANDTKRVTRSQTANQKVEKDQKRLYTRTSKGLQFVRKHSVALFFEPCPLAQKTKAQMNYENIQDLQQVLCIIDKPMTYDDILKMFEANIGHIEQTIQNMKKGTHVGPGDPEMHQDTLFQHARISLRLSELIRKAIEQGLLVYCNNNGVVNK